MSQSALLDQAFESQRIDRATWLLYRLYSLFGVDALPAEYQQGVATGDDMSLAAELQRGDPLPQGAHDQLAAFLSRPTDPTSVFHGRTTASAATVSRGGAMLAAAVTCDASNWMARGSTLHPGAFKVWTRCSGNDDHRLTATVNMLDALWDPMTGLMGGPVPDTVRGASDPATYGGDGAIDFYLIPRLTEVKAPGGRMLKISKLAAAVTVPTAPFTGNTSSAYILLDEGAVDDLAFKGVVAHEFFHALEMAHNQKVLFDRVCRFVVIVCDWEENWFTEASSVWATSHFTPEVAISDAFRFVPGFMQHTSLSLDARGAVGSTEWGHTYEDFVWLYFMEQEAGAGAIADAWKSQAMAVAANGNQGTAAFDESLSFNTHFEDFALRNLNESDLRRALGKLYQDQNRNFPLLQPPNTDDITVASGDPADPSKTVKVSVERLSAKYYSVFLGPGVQQVDWNLGQLTPAQNVHADLIVATPDGPRRISLAIGATQTVCFANPNAELIVSNGHLTAAASTTISAKGSSQPCGSAAGTPTPVSAPITCPGSVIGWPLIKGEYVSGPGNGGEGYQCSYRTPPVSGKGVPNGGIAYMTFDWSTSQQRLYVGEGCGAFTASGPPYHIESATRQASADWHVDISQLPYGEEHALDQQAVQAAYGDMQALLPAIEALGGPCP